MNLLPNVSSNRDRRWVRWLIRIEAGYLICLIVVTCLLWWTSDERAFGTMLLFGPRWIVTTPLLILLPLSLVTRKKRSLILNAASLFVASYFWCGLTVHPMSMLNPAAADERLRVITLNADGKSLNRAAFHQFLDQQNPDIVLLQDASRLSANDFPKSWHHASFGGLLVASRYKVTRESLFHHPSFQPGRGASRFRVETNIGELTIVNVHLPTPRKAFEAVIRRDADALQEVLESIRERSAASQLVKAWVGPSADRIFVAGDFNMPPESQIFRRDWGEFGNAFSASGNGLGWTMYTKHIEVRIDHILYAPPWRCRAAWVGPDIGSAHRPVIADFDLGG